ncbi:hypothetical protein DM02DRAFT_609096, partial [Periconia macrospinosa]
MFPMHVSTLTTAITLERLPIPLLLFSPCLACLILHLPISPSQETRLSLYVSFSLPWVSSLHDSNKDLPTLEKKIKD